MNRRAFLGCLPFLASLHAAEAQQTRTSRVGYVAPSPGPTAITNVFRSKLAELGYVEGQNLVIEYRWMAGRESAYPSVLGALAGKVDVVLVYGDVSIAAARTIAAVTPVVFVNAHEPVRLGLVQSLARPGGNMTGISNVESELIGKRLEILKQIVPRVSRFGAILDPASAATPLNLKELEAAARVLGVTIKRIDLPAPADIPLVVSGLTRDGIGAVVLTDEPWFFAHREKLVAEIETRRLVAAYPFRQFVDSGGLLSYSSNLADLTTRGAAYVGKILAGEKPANIPVERPTKFELVINLKTAKALGLTIPTALLQRADQVIE